MPFRFPDPGSIRLWPLQGIVAMMLNNGCIFLFTVCVPLALGIFASHVVYCGLSNHVAVCSERELFCTRQISPVTSSGFEIISALLIFFR